MEFDEIVVKESPGLCRCCLSEGCYKDLGTEYTWMNETEVYADMLLECFDISITQHNEGPNGPNRLICEVCITRLRDACNFKKQVMDSEKKFIDMMGRGEFRPKMLIYQTQLKCEGPAAVADPDDEDVEYLEDDIDFAEVNLKDDLTQPSVSDATVAMLPSKGKRGRPRKNTPVKPDKRAKVAKVDDKAKTSKAVAKAAKENENSNPCPDEDTQRSCNLFVGILQTSTAIPFRLNNNEYKPFRMNNSEYKCFYCPKNFCLPSQLRKHTQRIHVNQDLKEIVEKNMKRSILKLDISGLQCKMCYDNFEDTDIFVAHLQKHKLKVDNDLTHILSVKLSDVVISCYICKDKFLYLSSLLKHTQGAHMDGMFPCETCNISFSTKSSLIRHTGQKHKKIQFDCNVCGKKLCSDEGKKRHISRMHEIENRKCPVCFKVLGSADQKNTHLVKAHDVWTSQYKCDMCSRMFLRKNMLSNHIRREHFKEKNFTCEVCGQRFFSRHLLLEHQVKHKKSRPYTCVYCSKTFTRKKNLDIHERIHTDDRRCVCKECGQAFVQCASLQWHMRLHRTQQAKEETVSIEDPSAVAADESD